MAIEGIEKFEVEGKGRGIRATREFKIGQLICKAKPFAFVVFNEHLTKTCHNCLNVPGIEKPNQPAEPLMKCGSCKIARYCDRDCQRGAWSVHKKECAAMRRFSPGHAEDYTRLVSRLLWKREETKRDEETEQFVTIEELQDHLTNRTAEDRAILDKKVFEFGHYFSYDAMPESDEEMLHLFGAVDCNAIALNDPRGLNAIGVGLFPTISLLNHDCNPNCVAVSNGVNVELRCMRDVQMGEELCISYVDSIDTTEGRHDKLSKQYYFKCECNQCVNGGEIENLKHALLNDEVKAESEEYIIKFSQEMLRKMMHAKKKQDWSRMRAQAYGTLGQQELLLADTHALKLAVMNHLVEVMSYLALPDQAIDVAERVAVVYKQLLPAVHPTLGMYLMRLGILQWQLQKPEARDTLGKAANIIAKTHGEKHKMFLDLVGLIRQVHSEQWLMYNKKQDLKHAKKEARLRAQMKQAKESSEKEK